MTRKQGLVETAEGGTLFLDEIGDVPLAIQVKLLRLIETGSYRRVGSVETQRANFRLVAATHKGLEGMVAQGTFRQDLYYRISAFPVYLPALRQRADDLPILVDSILERHGHPSKDLRVSPSALVLMQQYHWPGNIRELRNVIERARLFADDGEIGLEHLPEHIQNGQVPAQQPLDAPSTARVEASKVDSNSLVQLVREFKGTRKALAAHLKVSERTLYRKLQQLGVSELLPD